MEITQEPPVKPVAGPGKVVTQEELEDENLPPLLISCGDPSTSVIFTFRMTQRELNKLEVLKGREELLRAEKRPILSQFLVKKAGRIFVLGEKQGRVQLCLAGESDSEVVLERIRTREATLEKLALVKRSQEARKRKIQNECRVVRLEEFRVAAAERRMRMEKKMLVQAVKEWQSMHKEDIMSNMIRPYLTCDESMLAEVRIAFEVFDEDGSGSISSSEFQALCYELGEIMDDAQTKEAMQLIDMDNNGVIQFHEFATWWVTDRPEGVGSSDSTNHKMLAMKLKMLKRAKTVYGKLNLFPGVGRQNSKKEKNKSAMLQPLEMKRPGETGGGMLGRMFGGKKNRPKTV